MRSHNGIGKKFLVIWAYAVEVIAAAALYGFAYVVAGPDSIAAFMIRSASQWEAAGLAAIGVSTAIWLGFLAILGTPFGKELRQTRAAAVYSSALAFPILVFSILVIVLMILPDPKDVQRLQTQDVLAPQIACLLTLYAAINLITVVRNVHGLVRLWQDWERFTGE